MIKRHFLRLPEVYFISLIVLEMFFGFSSFVWFCVQRNYPRILRLCPVVFGLHMECWALYICTVWHNNDVHHDDPGLHQNIPGTAFIHSYIFIMNRRFRVDQLSQKNRILIWSKIPNPVPAGQNPWIRIPIFTFHTTLIIHTLICQKGRTADPFF